MSTASGAPPDFAIIGGGIVGSFLAYYLAKSGHRVEVLDPSPGKGASSHNAGILALSYAVPMSNPKVLLAGAKSVFGGHRDFDISRPAGMRTFGWLAKFAVASRPGRAMRDAHRISGLADRSTALYERFSVDEGVDLGLRRSGWLYVARTQDALDAQIESAEQLQCMGIRHRTLRRSDLRSVVPEVSSEHIGGVHFLDDASMDPARVTEAVIAAARRRGARYSPERVVGVQRGAGGSVTVTADSGRRISAGTVVIAAGAESSQVAGLFGCRVPIEPGFGCSITVPMPARIASSALMSIEDHVVLNPGESTLRITGGMQFGGGAGTSPSPTQVTDLWRAAQRLLPRLGSLDSDASRWRGARPMTPDGLPRVHRLTDRVFINSGHGPLGMTLAPASAEGALCEMGL